MTDPLGELRGLFASVLELEPEDLDDDTDFFLAGGHSLLALHLAVAVEKHFGVELRVRDIAECPTPKELAVRLEGKEISVAESPKVANVGVDPTVRWLWIERQRGEAAPSAYNVPGLFHVRGEADERRLRDAVAGLHRRHPTLRSVFTEIDGEPKEEAGAKPPALHVVDLSRRPADAVAWEELVDAEIATPFDLATGPLLRTTLFRHPDGTWSVLFVADHLICDGRGLAILAHDLIKLYADPTCDSPVHPVDTTLETSAALEYWAERLTPVPEPLPLPVSRARDWPVERTEIVSTEVPEAMLSEVDAVARSTHTSRFVACTAAVARSLSELTGSEDVCVGTPVDPRSRTASTDTVGCHVATVPLRLAVSPTIVPRDLIAEVSGRVVDALDHSQIPFAELVAQLNPVRQPHRPPYFDVWVALYPHIDTGESEAGVSLYGGPVPLREGMFELSFQFVEHSTGMRLDIQYDVRRYDADTIRRMADRTCDSLRWLSARPESAPADVEDRARPQLFSGFRL